VEAFEGQQLRHHLSQVRIVFDDEHRARGLHVNPV
jgi:hypothetical protein